MGSGPILFHDVLWKRVEPVASTLIPTSCTCSRHYLAFKIREAVRHMSSSFTFKHNATKFQKILVDLASCSLFFKLRLLSQSFCIFACTQTPRFVWTNPKKAYKHSLSVNFHKLVVDFHSHADSAALRSNHFLLVDRFFDGEVLFNGHAVTQNYVFVVFQSEAIKEQFPRLIDHTC